METIDNAIDVVISYVDSTDPEWQTRYCQATGDNNAQDNCRFRNWNNLQFLFRGIERCMSWIHRVFLVVQSESQLPEWLNRQNDKLRVVYHDEYIPGELLPTFNANTIELFMHRIPGISPRFIVFNDDVFPLAPMEINNFFENAKPRILQKPTIIQANGQYWDILRNNVNLLRRIFPCYTGFTNAHLTHNILTQAMDEIVENELKTIVDGLKVSKLRDSRNYSIQLVKDYSILTNRAAQPNIKSSEVQMYDGIVVPNFPDVQIVCYNDTESVNQDFNRLQKDVNAILQGRFPNPSTFEIF